MRRIMQAMIICILALPAMGWADVSSDSVEADSMLVTVNDSRMGEIALRVRMQPQPYPPQPPLPPGPPGPPVPPPVAPVPPPPPGAIAVCTMSGATLTGREWGALMPTRNPLVATRVRLGGAAPSYYRSCYAFARELGLEIIDL